MQPADYYIIALIVAFGTAILAGINVAMTIRHNTMLTALNKEISTLELRILVKLEGTYVRTDMFKVQHENIMDKLTIMEKSMEKNARHTDSLLGEK